MTTPHRLCCTPDQRLRFSDVVSQNLRVGDILELIARIAPTDVPVLIEGETGTGKDLIARIIHDNSPRKDHPFVPVNCGALPADLIENELFGHGKGAFTGATEESTGLFEYASGGTLLLDEIDSASCAMQVKLLRVLEEGRIRRIGENDPRQMDARLICATKTSLTQEVKAGHFRDDLYYRIRRMHLVLPPLRERKEDILLLVTHFLKQYNRALDKQIDGVTDEAMDALLQCDWPGNVRELQHIIEQGALLCRSSMLSLDDLRLDLPESLPIGTLRHYERDLILRALHACHGNKSQAARTLGISPNTLYSNLRRYGLLGTGGAVTDGACEGLLK